MKVFRTSEGTDVVRLDNLRCNCYLMIRGVHCLLVDTGMSAQRGSIQRQIDGCGVKRLSAIVQTHYHTDHTQNTAYFQQKYDCPVYIHVLEAEGLADGRCVLPRGTTPWGKAVCSVQRRLHVMERFDPVDDVESLDEATSFSGFADSIEVLHTPGHTAGSTSLIVDDEIACVGDAMIHRGRNVYPPFADDEPSLLASWGKLLSTGSRVFLPAHGDAVDRVLLEANAAEKIR